MTTAAELAEVRWPEAIAQLAQRLAGPSTAGSAELAAEADPRQVWPLGALAPAPADHQDSDEPAARPFVMGASVGLAVDVPGFAVRGSWVRLVRDGDGWRRERREGIRRLPVTAGLIGPWTLDDDDPEVVLRAHVHWHEADWITSVLLVNTDSGDPDDPSSWVFAPELIVEPLDGDPALVRRPFQVDPAGVGWSSYNYDPDFVPVQAAPAMYGLGRGCGLLIDGVGEGADPPAMRAFTRQLVDRPEPGSPLRPDEDLLGPPLDALDKVGDDALRQLADELPAAYAAWLERERERWSDDEDAGPWRNRDRLAPEREARVLAAVARGREALDRAVVCWALKMACWVVRRQTGLARWSADQLALLLAALPALSGRELLEPQLLGCVELHPGAHHAAHLAMAVIELALRDE